MSTFAIFGRSFDDIKAKLIKKKGVGGFRLLRLAAEEFRRGRNDQLSPMYDDPHRALEFRQRCLERGPHRYKNLKLRAKIGSEVRLKSGKQKMVWRDIDPQTFRVLP